MAIATVFIPKDDGTQGGDDRSHKNLASKGVIFYLSKDNKRNYGLQKEDLNLSFWVLFSVDFSVLQRNT